MQVLESQSERYACKVINENDKIKLEGWNLKEQLQPDLFIVRQIFMTGVLGGEETSKIAG